MKACIKNDSLSILSFLKDTNVLDQGILATQIDTPSATAEYALVLFKEAMANLNDQKLKDILLCSICYDTVNSNDLAVFGGCGHINHASCVENIRTINGGVKHTSRGLEILNCPTCRDCTSFSRSRTMSPPALRELLEYMGF